MKMMASGPSTSWKIDGETMETVTDFLSRTPKSLQMVTAAMKLKDAWLLGSKAIINLEIILKSRDITLSKRSFWLRLWFFQCRVWM